MNIETDQIYNCLQKQFYYDVPFPIDHSFLEEAMQAFFKFLEEPDFVKNTIDFSINKIHRRGDVGYKHRNPDDDIYNDSKDFFHFHPAIFTKYPEFLKEHPVVQDFMQKALPIWEAAYNTVQQILQTFESQFPGVCEKVFDTQNSHILIRFLRYNWQNSQKYLAKPHFDAGSFTLAIAESCPGLRIGSKPENLQLIQHKEGHAVFMLASNFQKIMATEELSAGWHDVIQLDETMIGKPFARWAIVAFVDAHGVEALPRSETHKWYKDEQAA